MYREQKTMHGDYATVSVYPVFRTGRKRRGRYRATSEVQQRLNEFNARERLGRQLDANMQDGGVHAVLTYDETNLPTTRAAAIKTWQTFKRRLARYYKNEGLGELKAAAAIHGDVHGPRMHIHIVINQVINKFALTEIWRNGLVTRSDELYFGPLGLRGLAEYIMRGMIWGRVMTTRNMIDPQTVERTGRVRADEVEELAEKYDAVDPATIQANWDDKTAYEGRWPGYKIAEVKPFFNWFNRQYYLRIYLYKESAVGQITERRAS